jgi:hypothetical protein
MTEKSQTNVGGRYVIPKGGNAKDAKRVEALLDGKTPNPAHSDYTRPVKVKPAQTAPDAPLPADSGNKSGK